MWDWRRSHRSWNSIMNRCSAIVNQYRAKSSYVCILPTPKRNKTTCLHHTHWICRPPPPSADVDEQEPPLLPTPPTETPFQLPTPPKATQFKPPNQRKEKKGKRLFPSPVMTRSRRQQKVTGLRRMTIADIVSKETVCCVGGKVKHQNRLSTTRLIR